MALGVLVGPPLAVPVRSKGKTARELRDLIEAELDRCSSGPCEVITKRVVLAHTPSIAARVLDTLGLQVLRQRPVDADLPAPSLAFVSL